MLVYVLFESEIFLNLNRKRGLKKGRFRDIKISITSWVLSMGNTEEKQWSDLSSEEKRKQLFLKKRTAPDLSGKAHDLTRAVR